MDLIEYHLIRQFISHISSSLTDTVDRINYVYTPVIFIFCCSTLLLKCVIFEPIFCWSPFEFPIAWESYAKSYCWVQPTYNLSPDGGFPNENEKNLTKTNYYQWVPFILLIHAIISRLPMELWKALSKKVGIDLQARLKEIKSDKVILDQEEDVTELVETFADMLESRTTDYDLLYTSGSRLGDFFHKLKHWGFIKYFNNRRGSAIFVYYLTIKFVTIIVALVQIYIMKKFLCVGSDIDNKHQFDYLFGYKILRNLITGVSWRESLWFPRTVGCDVIVRGTGHPIIYPIQCVFPGNMLNEKYYLFFWFWLLICGVSFTFCSILYWCIEIIAKNKRENCIRELLVLYDLIKDDELSSEVSSVNPTTTNSLTDTEKNLENFVHNFLRIDGVFLIHMIRLHCRNYFTLHFVGMLYDVYKKRRKNIETENTIFL